MLTRDGPGNLMLTFQPLITLVNPWMILDYFSEEVGQPKLCLARKRRGRHLKSRLLCEESKPGLYKIKFLLYLPLHGLNKCFTFLTVIFAYIVLLFYFLCCLTVFLAYFVSLSAGDNQSCHPLCPKIKKQPIKKWDL